MPHVFHGTGALNESDVRCQQHIPLIGLLGAAGIRSRTYLKHLKQSASISETQINFVSVGAGCSGDLGEIKSKRVHGRTCKHCGISNNKKGGPLIDYIINPSERKIRFVAI